jgi:hypothetical protein
LATLDPSHIQSGVPASPMDEPCKKPHTRFALQLGTFKVRGEGHRENFKNLKGLISGGNAHRPDMNIWADCRLENDSMQCCKLSARGASPLPFAFRSKASGLKDNTSEHDWSGDDGLYTLPATLEPLRHANRNQQLMDQTS